MKINEQKILKEIEKINKQLSEKSYFFTLKGIISIVVNLVEEQLKGEKDERPKKN